MLCRVKFPLVAMVLAGALSVPAMAAPAKPAYVGAWTLAPGDCKEPEIVLTRRTLGMVDAECALSGIAGGRGVWRATARCQGDGAKPKQRVTIWASKMRLTLQFGRDPRRDNFSRCS